MPSQAAGHRSWLHWEVHRGAGRQLFAYVLGNRVKTGVGDSVRTRPFIDILYYRFYPIWQSQNSLFRYWHSVGILFAYSRHSVGILKHTDLVWQ